MNKIIFYEDKKHNSEIKEYFDRISCSSQKDDKKIYRKVMHQLNMLELLGRQLHEPNAKYLKGYKYPLFELRPQPERIFYVTWQKDKFVLLSHYTKKSNRTDPREINKALRLAQNWYERFGM